MRLFQQQTRSSFPTFFCSKGAIAYNAQVMLIEKTADFSSCPHMGLGGHKEEGVKTRAINAGKSPSNFIYCPHKNLKYYYLLP